MKSIRYIFSLLLATAFLYSYAQESRSLGIKMNGDYPARKKGSMVLVDMEVDLTAMPSISTNLTRVIVPVLRSESGEQEVLFPSFVIAGKRRYAIIQRRLTMDKSFKITDDQTEKTQIIRRVNGHKQLLHYAMQLPYQPWMKKASLYLKADDSGCANCALGSAEQMLASPFLYPLYEAKYKMGIVVPKGELEKHREESITANISFLVGKYNILPNHANNAQEIARVRSKMDELKRDKNITFKRLDLVGYASPEGGVQYNVELSKNRVEAFANYLSSIYPFLKGKLKTDWKGQDWAGLKAAIDKASFDHKDEVLEALKIANPDERTAALKRIEGGSVYSMLLRDFYPPLRRTELIFNIVVKGFSLEEAKETFETHPSRLSLAEVYAVAQSYPEGSAEQYRVWSRADQIFTKDVEPAINAAVLDLRAGRYGKAVERLQRRESDERIWGMLGLAYAYTEEWQKAESYLRKAQSKGDKLAAHNLIELQRYMEDNL